MARIYKRGKIWYLDISVKGRRVRKRVGTSKKMAELALKDAEVKVARDEFGFSSQDIKVGELIERFLEYNRTNHRPSTMNRYKAVTDHFRRYLTEKQPSVAMLSQLTPEVLEGYKTFRRDEWVNPNGKPVDGKIRQHTRKGARARTVNLELEGLKTMLNLARRWGYLKDNPVNQVKPLKTDDKRTVRFLSVEECHRLLEAATPEYYSVLFTFLNSGLRKSELEYLRWSDIDLRRGAIAIRSKADWKPKTGEREVPMTDELKDLFQKLKAKNKPEQDDFIFPIRDRARSHNWLRNELIRTALRAGITDLTRVHTLRHTFASHLVMNGVDLPTVGKLLGHSDIETTMIYAHLAPEHLVKAVAKLPFRATE
ncbi:tyrosine-type recombinase/integrase [bacterium]|nr:tyrosine-type recombinase/integrase [bacterium]